MQSLPSFQDRLVIESTLGGTSELIAQWRNSPKGWELLTRQMIALQEQTTGAESYRVRQAQATDNLEEVPSILRAIQRS